MKKPLFFFAVFLLLGFWGCGLLRAAQIRMKDGRVLQGEVAQIAKVDQKTSQQPWTRSILLIDDGLRRVYVPRRHIILPIGSDPEPLLRYKFDQPYASLESSGKYESIGDCRLEKFDPYGRRLVALSFPDRVDYEVQSIVEITPRYIRTRGVNHVWDARYSVLSIPRAQLSPILKQKIDPGNYEERMGLFRFYVLAKYYEAAVEELDSIIEDFRDDPVIEQRIIPARRRIQQLDADRLMDEINIRSESGQHRFAREQLQSFKTDGTSITIMQRVRQMLGSYEAMEQNRTRVVQRLRELNETIGDEEVREQIGAIIGEIERELNENTIERMDSFRLSDQDPALSEEEKLALGLSSWFIGKNTEIRRLTVAISLAKTRDLLRSYLQANDLPSTEEIFDQIRQEEAGTPELIAELLGLIKPPMDTPQFDPERPGYYELERKGIPGSPDYAKIGYCVQLPPEYDPNRKYPTLIALHPASRSSAQELDWWCGPWKDGIRFGKPTREGYIVIAPKWTFPGQISYDFSPLVHAAVLFSLRDAFGRFNIDTDRVFLTGHGIGGNAAWDIGLAHPDLWAGVIPFCAVAGGPILDYDTNAQHVPLYFVGGELDCTISGGTVQNKLVVNGDCFNHYLRTQNGYNTTAVQYIGRGSEMYGEEDSHIFTWMKNLKRTLPTEFTAKCSRPQNDFYFFWGLEFPLLPEEEYWPRRTADGSRILLEAKYRYFETQNRLKIETGSNFSKYTPVVYLTREMMKFDQRVDIEVNGRKYQPRGNFVEPDLRLILEDARTRKDRQHPFWVRLTSATRQ